MKYKLVPLFLLAGCVTTPDIPTYRAPPDMCTSTEEHQQVDANFASSMEQLADIITKAAREFCELYNPGNTECTELKSFVVSTTIENDCATGIAVIQSGRHRYKYKLKYNKPRDTWDFIEKLQLSKEDQKSFRELNGNLLK